MKGKFHQLCVEIALNAMPAEFQEKFLAGFSLELLKENAAIDYVPATELEPSYLHLGHSLKLQLKGRDLHKIGGTSPLDDLVRFAKSVEELSKADKPMLVRYSIAKGTHYIIDLGTFSHVNYETWDKYHEKFEDLAESWLEQYKPVVEQLVKNYAPNPMRSINNRARKIAETAFYDSIEMLPAFKRNASPTDLQLASMCCKHVYNVMDWFSTFQNSL